MEELSSVEFTAKELRCGCDYCAKLEPHRIHPVAFAALLRVRRRYGKPMILNSAYRCARHPDEAKKSQPGKHFEGLAFDISVPWGQDRAQLLKIAIEEGFRGFGFADTFLHIDYRPGPETTWGYS